MLLGLELEFSLAEWAMSKKFEFDKYVDHGNDIQVGPGYVLRGPLEASGDDMGSTPQLYCEVENCVMGLFHPHEDYHLCINDNNWSAQSILNLHHQYQRVVVTLPKKWPAT